jgi:hypothetical protein
LRALIEQLPRPVALAGGFEVATGGSALRSISKTFFFLMFPSCVTGGKCYPLEH